MKCQTRKNNYKANRRDKKEYLPKKINVCCAACYFAAASAVVIVVALFLDFLFHSYLFILVWSVFKCKAKLLQAGPKINNNKNES